MTSGWLPTAARSCAAGQHGRPALRSCIRNSSSPFHRAIWERLCFVKLRCFRHNSSLFAPSALLSGVYFCFLFLSLVRLFLSSAQRSWGLLISGISSLYRSTYCLCASLILCLLGIWDHYKGGFFFVGRLRPRTTSTNDKQTKKKHQGLPRYLPRRSLSPRPETRPPRTPRLKHT